MMVTRPVLASSATMRPIANGSSWAGARPAVFAGICSGMHGLADRRCAAHTPPPANATRTSNDDKRTTRRMTRTSRRDWTSLRGAPIQGLGAQILERDSLTLSDSPSLHAPAQQDVKCAASAMTQMCGFEARDARAVFGPLEPTREFSADAPAEHASYVEAQALAGDDQHHAVSLADPLGEEMGDRALGLRESHAVQVERRLRRTPAARQGAIDVAVEW